MKKVLCPKCGSNNIEQLELVEIVDFVDEDELNFYYLAKYLYMCYDCYDTFYLEDEYVESKHQVYRKEECK